MNSSSLDGIYYEYSDYEDDLEYWEELKVVIKDDKLVQTTETAGDIAWNLDKKSNTMTYAGIESTVYTIKGDILSFNNKVYVKKGSDTFQSAKKHEEKNSPDDFLVK